MNVSSDVSRFPGSDPNLSASSRWTRAFDSGILPLSVGNEDVAKAILTLFSYRKLGKTVLINPPYAQHCGLSFHFESSKRFRVQSEVKRVMRTLAEYLNSEYPGSYIDIAFPPEVKDIQPFLHAGFDVGLGYTYRIGLDRSPAELLSAFSSERRKNVRDAEKAGLTTAFDDDPAKAIGLIRNTLDASGLHYDMETLKRMIDSDWTFTVSVSNGSQLLATALIAFDTRCAYYIAGGTVKNAANSGSGALVLWEAIKKAREMGLAQFDFSGSSVPAIEKFFRGFGGELTPYFRVRKNTKLFDILKSTKDKFTSL